MSVVAHLFLCSRSISITECSFCIFSPVPFMVVIGDWGWTSLSFREAIQDHFLHCGLLHSHRDLLYSWAVLSSRARHIFSKTKDVPWIVLARGRTRLICFLLYLRSSALILVLWPLKLLSLPFSLPLWFFFFARKVLSWEDKTFFPSVLIFCVILTESSG